MIFKEVQSVFEKKKNDLASSLTGALIYDICVSQKGA